jgi:hypothetical protein
VEWRPREVWFFLALSEDVKAERLLFADFRRRDVGIPGELDSNAVVSAATSRGGSSGRGSIGATGEMSLRLPLRFTCRTAYSSFFLGRTAPRVLIDQDLLF